MRRAAKVDRNHAEVVAALRAAGAAVQSLAAVGRGCPDLLVSRGGKNLLMEVKDGNLPVSKRALTSDQIWWIDAWEAPVYVVNSPTEAVARLEAG